MSYQHLCLERQACVCFWFVGSANAVTRSSTLQHAKSGQCISWQFSVCLFTFNDKTVPYIFLTTAPGRAFWSLDWRLSFRSPWAQPRDEEQDLISSPDPLLADTRRPQRWWHCEFPHEPAMAQTLSGRKPVGFVENWWKTRKSFQSTVSASTYEYFATSCTCVNSQNTAKSLLH